MDSSQSLSSSMEKSSTNDITTHKPVPLDGFIGILEVFVHQASEIQNICIYHKQDVYARLCLTSDPEVTISTRTINGGGKNPVFNETLRLNVRTTDSSLKCEVWMLSRVKNYLKDQLLGFAIVPLSDVIMSGAGGSNLGREFSLSSNDLFHSPAGFVQLSLSYFGYSPEVMAVPAPLKSLDSVLPDSETNGNSSILLDYEKVDIPDLMVAKENQMMVSEYFGIPCTDLDTQTAKNLIAPESDNCFDDDDDDDDDAGVRIVESFTSGSSNNSVLKENTPQSSVSTNGCSAISQSFSGPSAAVTSVAQKDKTADGAEFEADSSVGMSADQFSPPVINLEIEPERALVSQDFADMYTKSMHQFTESLAKMKLPMDIESSTSTEVANRTSEEKVQEPKGTGSRVFYGSRAFF